jgi:cell wall-associated NlpC family hydrolase
VTEVEERQRVVREAQSWLGTPYHDNGDVKGAGVDCGMLLVRVYVDTGLVPAFDPRPYPAQWSLHQKAERYLEIVRTYAHEIPGPPLPGDIAMFKFGLTYSHGAIVVAWPRLIHANPPGHAACRYVDDVFMDSTFIRLMRDMPPKFFSIWPREGA